MPAIDAVFADGAFRPLAPVSLPENQRVKLTVEAAELPPPGPRPQRTPEEIQAALAWITQANAFREQLAAKYGVLPDSTLDIAADRHRDD